MNPTLAATLDMSQLRVRDRYVALRFPGVLRNSADLIDADKAIAVARGYFEEADIERANEVLALAIAQSTESLALEVAQLEMAFLARDSARVARLTREFHARYPGIAQFEGVVRPTWEREVLAIDFHRTISDPYGCTAPPAMRLAA